MKPIVMLCRKGGWQSPPARGRGLKPSSLVILTLRLQVAPRAGAWIETRPSWVWFSAASVAPRAGAWIETVNTPNIDHRPYVAPRAGAWIETTLVIIVYLVVGVAPRAGAWIETSGAGQLARST